MINFVLWVDDLFQQWYDDYLKWDPDDYDGQTHVVLPHGSIWMPEDVDLVNS